MSINIQGKLRIKGLTTGGNPGGGPNYTFKTTQIGGTNYFQSSTTTGYIKFNSTVYPSNDEVQFTLDDPNGEYTLVSCLSDGTPSGDITNLNFTYGNQITSFNGAGLSSLTNLTLNGNQLTSFDGTGLSSLTYLQLESNQLTSFNGAGLSALTDLTLTNNPLTSFNGGDMSLIPYLDFPSWNITTLESFDGGNMTGLIGLALSYNQLTSIDVSVLPALTELYTFNNLLDSSDNNSILAQLDTNGLSNGYFNSSGGRTSASDTNYNNLIGKSWTIDVNV